MTFGSKLKKIRKDNHLTQDELANMLFVTRSAISKWENDKGFPEIESLKQISNSFHISLDELLSDDDVENKKLLDKQKAKKMYSGAIVSLLITFLCTAAAYFTQNSDWSIGSYVAMIAYIVFGVLSKPKYKRSEVKKLIVPYLLSRVVLLILIIFIMMQIFQQI